MPSDQRAFHSLLARAPASYHYLAIIARDGWAWEFLRRSPAYMQSCDTLALDPRRWDLLSYVDPAHAADRAPVFWSQDSHYVLTVSCAPAPVDHRHSFDFRDARCDVHTLRSGDAEQHVLLMDEGRRLQLAVTGAPVLGRVLLSPVAGQTGTGSTRRHELRRALDYLVMHGRLPARLYRAEAGAHRLLFILLALDAARAGASVRDQAQLLLGATRVQHGGGEQMRALRAQIQRAVARGEWLVREGYRSLLA